MHISFTWKNIRYYIMKIVFRNKIYSGHWVNFKKGYSYTKYNNVD